MDCDVARAWFRIKNKCMVYRARMDFDVALLGLRLRINVLSIEQECIVM